MKVNIGPFPKKAQRRVLVEISRSDTFSMDSTLAYVVLPMLIQLKLTKHGIPHDFAEVGGEDYQSQDSFDFYKENVNEYFENRVKEWEDVLDKMIWSFQQLLEDYEEKYRHGKSEYDWVKTDRTHPNPVTGKPEATYKMIDKNPSEHWTDYEGLRKHEERIQEGLDLFGKYYRNLWD